MASARKRRNNALFQQALFAGWGVSRGSSGLLRVFDPQGKFCGTASCWERAREIVIDLHFGGKANVLHAL